ncbi:hypothetical protein Cgig2_034088 [Carnegiea gigantea]|uniref:Endonuclease/exonuclease/phosphatase domain-containing protein n=1 Tax=Carnegiea gigantea TaxID=171969 RepID=A0A9Q1QAN9_9CARY|nr:hypothetical protein Cgig2_034088 [Carnegiea gigantea]
MDFHASSDVTDNREPNSAPNSDEIVPSPEAIDHLATPQPRVHSSYAAMVDPNEGTSLNFIPVTVVNGVKCAKLTQADVSPEIDYWVPMSYEWKPLKCTYYRMFGRLETDCGKKHQPKQVWKPVQRHVTLPSPVQPMADKEDGFIPVSQHASAKSLRQRQSAASCSRGQQEHFYVTFVYGDNHDLTRRELWHSLIAIAEHMDDPWCVLGDFNVVLYSGDRMGGIDIHDFEVKPSADCIATCELQELRFLGPYFTWSNKTIWSKIDRVFTNALWYGLFGVSQTRYLPNSRLDHTTMVIESPGCPTPSRLFHFYDMWTRDAGFIPIIVSCLTTCTHCPKGIQLKPFLSKYLAAPNNLELQQQEAELRAHYTSITTSALDVIKQQSKADWISYGDEYSKYFFAEVKQRKAETYVYDILDYQGQPHSGFSAVAAVL